MADRAQRERELRAENRRLKASLDAIHNALHANEVGQAHELCECALGGEEVSQPNVSAADGAKGFAFAADFNRLAQRAGVRACCIMLQPSKTVPNAVSLQLCGDVLACKLVEEQLRGEASTYMGDHAAALPAKIEEQTP